MPDTILALDDELPILRLIELTLQGDYQVTTFSRPREALAALQGGLTPQLILCDINMPGMTGFEFHEELRKIGALRSAPFVYLTAMGDQTHFRQGMRLGADDYLTKPFSTGELFDTVRMRLARAELLRQREDEVAPQLSVLSLGGLEISLGERRIRWGAKKAAEVFLFLLAAQGDVRRDALKKELWWEDIAEGSFRVINSRVRKATQDFAEVLSDDGVYRVQVRCEVVWDALHFETLAKEALERGDFEALQAAAQAYGGEFLPEFDSPWTERQRGYYDGLYLELLETSLARAPSEALEFEAQRQLEAYFDRS